MVSLCCQFCLFGLFVFVCPAGVDWVVSVYSVEQAANGASGIGLVSMWGQAGDDLSVSGDVDGAASFSFGKNPRRVVAKIANAESGWGCRDGIFESLRRRFGSHASTVAPFGATKASLMPIDDPDEGVRRDRGGASRGLVAPVAVDGSGGGSECSDVKVGEGAGGGEWDDAGGACRKAADGREVRPSAALEGLAGGFEVGSERDPDHF